MVSQKSNLMFQTGLLSQDQIKKLLNKHQRGEKVNNDIKIIK